MFFSTKYNVEHWTAILHLMMYPVQFYSYKILQNFLIFWQSFSWYFVDLVYFFSHPWCQFVYPKTHLSVLLFLFYLDRTYFLPRYVYNFPLYGSQALDLNSLPQLVRTVFSRSITQSVNVSQILILKKKTVAIMIKLLHETFNVMIFI